MVESANLAEPSFIGGFRRMTTGKGSGEEPQNAAENCKRQPQMNANDTDGVRA
jgi:hypothetical protein